ncbi:unnamed protein product, partial [Rotaria sp. Silwood2]
MATKGRGASNEEHRKLALVIGIGEYENFDQLSNPENDARDMESALESIGFTVTMVLHLKRVEMKHALVKFEDSIQPGDMVLFYFAGHGTQWEDQNYLLPKDIPDAQSVNLNRSAINAQDVLNTLDDRNPFVTIFLLDCCRKYYLRNPKLDERGDPHSSDSSPADFKPMHKAGSLIAFACAPGTGAIENRGQRNGLFTKHLLQHIKTPNEDIQMILRVVRRGVVEESKSKQIPFLSDGLLETNICLYSRPTERAYNGYTVKVCDFGVARTRNETTRQTKSNNTLAITLQWTAPEILRLGRYTDKSDIYSLGIVYWELATYQIPYDGHEDGVIRAFVLAGDRLDIPDTTPSIFRMVIEQCWTQNPNDRPDGCHLIQMIEECIQVE